MNVEGKPIKVRDTVFFPRLSPKGNTLWKSGEVRDFNEAVKCVKVLFFIGSNEKAKGKTEWFPAANLRLTDPNLTPAS